ncbi:MAG: FAD-dependent oxidoreductase [Deltaproteobacteria bacterium]|nr:FAD-dependent oxidoreductase [Deltaproteobacteria bacterium]
MGKHLVFVGGGHAHLTSLKLLSNFRKLGHQVTVISSSPYHYYSGMGPGMLSGIYQPREVRFHVKKLAEERGAAFIKGTAVKIDPREHFIFLDTGEKVPYDVVSFNIGSEVPVESLAKTPAGNLFPVKPVINLLTARRSILEAIRNNRMLRFVVVGGGPAGVEISANLLGLLRENRGRGEITLIGGKRLLADAPEKARRLVRESLTCRGVTIIEGSRVKAVEKGQVTLSDGKRFDMDLAFLAIGIQPSSLFRDSGIPTGADGGMLVNARLQSVAHPDIFGGGDCISLEGHSLAKVGVYAVRENPVLYHNLLAALEGGKMDVFAPQKKFLLIFNMGNGKGIFWKGNWVWEGRLAFLLKNYIDRKFMRTFQVSGELDEQSEGFAQ